MNLLKKKSTKELVKGRNADEGGKAPDAAAAVKTPSKEKSPKERKERSKPVFYRTKLFWGVLSIVLGLLICFIAVPMLRNATTDTVEVVCFAEDVKAGAVIDAAMLTTVELARYHLPAGVIYDLDAAIGSYVTTDAIAGDFVTAARLSSVYLGSDISLLDLPDGYVAISISLPDLAQSVSGKLRKGDIIQIFAVDGDSASLYASAPAELQYVEVLAATYSDGTDINDQGFALSNGSSNAEIDDVLATVTLCVNARQAALLAGLEENATLHAALVVRGNDAQKAAVLEVQREILAQLDAAADPDPDTEPVRGVGEGAS